MVEFKLLGPLVVSRGNEERTVPASKQRVVLASLLLGRNQVVPVDRIAGAIWGYDPPPTATATIRTYVMRLRQFLGPDGGARISTRAPGYVISVRDDETDLGRFTAHRARAARSAERGDLPGAACQLREALALWRHDPLLDVHSRLLQDTHVRHLQELRLQTQIWRIDLDLGLHRHAEILPELWQLVLQSPLNESLAARLIRALSLAGRQSEAFDIYRQTRACLIDKLGVEPGTELQGTLQWLLRADDVAAAPTQAANPAVISPPRPAQLPAATANFTGRIGESRLLEKFLGDGPATTVISGAAGSGKSALAVQVAHQLRERFRDGQLHADLTGPGDEPISATEVLKQLAVSLGVPAADLPRLGFPGLVSTYRSLLADRQLLILLDGAQTAAQVRPLLPGAGDSRVVITSRAPLTDLDGAQRLPMTPLDDVTGVELLNRIVGPERIQCEPAAARRVVVACSGLPLAIRIAGARLIARPNWTAEMLADRLADSARMLDELRIGDLDVRTGLRLTYGRLSPHSVAGIDVRAAWQMLAVAKPATLDGRAAADRLGCSVAAAEEILDVLVDAHLLNGQPYRITPLQHAFCLEMKTPATAGA